MTIKQQGGIFGRKPTFNDVEASDVVSKNFRVTGTFPAYQLDETDTTDQNWQIRVNGGELLFQKQNDTFSNAITSMRITQSNNLKVANGAGIDFSATSGTGTSELFDDYEEGTWTAGLGAVTTNPTTPITATGTYTKIGRKVTVSFTLSGDTTGASGTTLVTGLPYAIGASDNYYSGLITKNLGADAASAYGASGNSYFALVQQVGFGYIAITAGAGRQVAGTFSYFTA